MLQAAAVAGAALVIAMAVVAVAVFRVYSVLVLRAVPTTVHTLAVLQAMVLGG